MCSKFQFKCVSCNTINLIDSAFRIDNRIHIPILAKCSNKLCTGIPPYHYLGKIQNAMTSAIRSSILRYYENWLVCSNSSCNANTRNYCHAMKNNRPICMQCGDGMLFRQYTPGELHNQLFYYQHMFDLSKYNENCKLIIYFDYLFN